MKTTITTPLSERLLKSDPDVLPFLNKELVPLNREFRAAHNMEVRQLVRSRTTGNGLGITAWVSDPMPTGSAWRVFVDVLARAPEEPDESGSYGRVALFVNEGGTVSQVGATVALWTFESAAGCDCTLQVVGQSVTLMLTDDGVSAMDWKVIVSILPSDEV